MSYNYYSLYRHNVLIALQKTERLVFFAHWQIFQMVANQAAHMLSLCTDALNCDGVHRHGHMENALNIYGIVET